MTHGHEVLDMMAGNSYATKADLVAAIIQKFGSAERFYTCSASDLTAEGLVDFLEARGKFMASGGTGFTADPTKRCSHDA